MESQAEITTTEQCAERIIELARQQLDTELPELQPAIYLLPALPVEAGPDTSGLDALWTDGDALLYFPEPLAQAYSRDRESIARLLLHIFVHGLLGHFEDCEGKDPQLFQYSADLEATDFLLRFARQFLRLKGSCETKQMLNAQSGCTAKQIYATILESGARFFGIREIVRPLNVDNHRWSQFHMPSAERAARWAEAARLTAINLRDAGRDDLAERLEP